jgi:hypothetical protein
LGLVGELIPIRSLCFKSFVSQFFVCVAHAWPGPHWCRCAEFPSPGDLSPVKYLFIQADVPCSATGWQAPLWILLVMLLLFPGLLATFLRHAIHEVTTPYLHT